MMMRCLSCRACTFCFVAAVWLLQQQQQQPVVQPVATSLVSSLRKTTTTTTRQRQRRVQVSTFLTYTTTSIVQEEALLDQDVLAMGARLALNTVDGMDNALSIYKEGRLADTSLTLATFTLQSLSTTLDTTSTSSLFEDYYGVLDYANQWILGAFQDEDSIATTFTNGKMDFSLFATHEGQAAAIKTATVVMSFWMHVVQGLYLAIDSCNSQHTTSALNYWDQAVAFYTGSMITTEPESQGVLLYSLAQVHCKTFGTCDLSSSGMAKVNIAVFSEFQKGQENLQSAKCQGAMSNADSIVNWMKVPLIQGTLSSMYAMDFNNDARETTRAQGVAYAAAILPLLDQCGPKYAALVHRDMEVGNDSLGSFQVVKEALELQYDCLDITCEDVGGIVDLVNPGQYVKGAEPCGSLALEEDEEGDEEEKDKNAKSASSSKNVEVGLAIGLVLVLAVVLVLGGCTVRYLCRRQEAAHSFDRTNNSRNQIV